MNLPNPAIVPDIQIARIYRPGGIAAAPCNTLARVN
jgi:hypothetical protein